MGRYVVGWFSFVWPSAYHRCHPFLLFSKGELIKTVKNDHEKFSKALSSFSYQHKIHQQTFSFQVLTREKKKIRSAEQYRQQIVIPSQNSSNSLPRQSQTSTLKPPPPASGNGGKDSGYGKDLKGFNFLNFQSI